MTKDRSESERRVFQIFGEIKTAKNNNQQVPEFAWLRAVLNFRCREVETTETDRSVGLDPSRLSTEKTTMSNFLNYNFIVKNADFNV